MASWTNACGTKQLKFLIQLALPWRRVRYCHHCGHTVLSHASLYLQSYKSISKAYLISWMIVQSWCQDLRYFSASGNSRWPPKKNSWSQAPFTCPEIVFWRHILTVLHENGMEAGWTFFERSSTAFIEFSRFSWELEFHQWSATRNLIEQKTFKPVKFDFNSQSPVSHLPCWFGLKCKGYDAIKDLKKK